MPNTNLTAFRTANGCPTRMDLLPADTNDYRHEQSITAIAPSKTVVEVEGGKWVFKGI